MSFKLNKKNKELVVRTYNRYRFDKITKVPKTLSGKLLLLDAFSSFSYSVDVSQSQDILFGHLLKKLEKIDVKNNSSC